MARCGRLIPATDDIRSSKAKDSVNITHVHSLYSDRKAEGSKLELSRPRRGSSVRFGKKVAREENSGKKKASNRSFPSKN